MVTGTRPRELRLTRRALQGQSKQGHGQPRIWGRAQAQLEWQGAAEFGVHPTGSEKHLKDGRQGGNTGHGSGSVRGGRHQALAAGTSPLTRPAPAPAGAPGHRTLRSPAGGVCTSSCPHTLSERWPGSGRPSPETGRFSKAPFSDAHTAGLRGDPGIRDAACKLLGPRIQQNLDLFKCFKNNLC